jgi:hypothetical protein
MKRHAVPGIGLSMGIFTLSSESTSARRFSSPNQHVCDDDLVRRVSMGRIGWFDALARRRYGDLQTFDNLLLNPIRDDLNAWTWVHER